MTDTSKIRIAIAGAAGAFGMKHLEALANIPEVTVVSIIDFDAAKMDALAQQYNIEHCTNSLTETLNRDDIDAVILATPTQLHAKQAIECMTAGKHVMIEIPMADNIQDARQLVEIQKQTGLVAMAGHTRRFNPSHQWIHNKIQAGTLTVQQMDIQTYFFRRTNTNAKGEIRTWTDHLLWHHACHSVDLFSYQTNSPIEKMHALQGRVDDTLNIAMDMSIIMKSQSDALCTLSLSFNNEGPFGTFFRYICDNGTYTARDDELYDGHDNPIDLSNVAVSMNGIDLQDREFINAIKENRAPNSSVKQCLETMENLHKLEEMLKT